jgi:hypothetical protein
MNNSEYKVYKFIYFIIMIKIILLSLMISSTLTNNLEEQFTGIMNHVSATIQRQSNTCTDKLCIINHNYASKYDFKIKESTGDRLVGDLTLHFNVYYTVKLQFFDDNSSYDYTVILPNFTFTQKTADSFNNPVFSFRTEEPIQRYNLIRRLGAHGIGVEAFFTELEKDYGVLSKQLEESFENTRIRSPEILLKFLQ